MSRTLFNLAIDLAAAALFLGMAATGFILGFAVPPGTNRTLSLWGLTRHQWGAVHLWISFALLGVVLLHVCLHWQWVVAVVGKRLGLKPSPGTSLLRTGAPTLLALAAAVGLFAWLTRAGVREIDDPGRLGVCPPAAEGEAARRPGAPPGAPTGSGRTPVAFWEDVYPVLERACLGCHGPRRQMAGFRVDRREDFFGKGGRDPQVIPGDSTRSPLITLVSGRRTDVTPAEAHRLPGKDVALLRAWIDAGAGWPDRPAGK